MKTMRRLPLLFSAFMFSVFDSLVPVLAADVTAQCRTSDPFRNPQKTYDVCNRAIHASSKMDLDKAVSLAQRGESYYWVNHLNEAVSDFDAALAISPELNETRIQRGWAKMRTGNIEGAFTDFTDAVERDQKSGRAVFALGFMQRDEALARKAYEQSIALSPDYYLAHNALAGLDRRSTGTRRAALLRYDFLLSQGKKKLNTVKFASFGGELDTKDFYNSILFDRSDLLYDLGRYDESVAGFRKLQKLDATQPAPYMREAEALIRLQDFEAAARVSEFAYNVCMERRYFSMCGKATVSLMQANLRLGKFENVIKQQGEVESSQHENVVRAMMSITVAQAYKSMGNPDKARVAFVRTGELWPQMLGLISDPMARLGYYDGYWEGKQDERFWNGLEACLLDETCKVNL
jgi:tetratricopeptide (TPR) repeat protein